MGETDTTQTSVSVSGELSAPRELGDLSAQTAAIEQEYEPQIVAQEQHSRELSSESVAASEKEADEAERMAGDLTAQDQEMQKWLDSTPTHQASMATAMHAAPVLSILIALGGRVTRLNGMQMLAATNGMVQGINQASKDMYEQSYRQWEAAYQKMQDHQKALMEAHRLMLTSFQGRADAYQKASDAARRMTGDLLDDKQRKISQTIDTFKAQQAALDKAARLKYSYAELHRRQTKDLEQAAHWKAIDAKAAQMPPQVKAQLAAEKQRWQNAKSQIDENMKRRGQINGNLSMSEDAKASVLAQIDAEDEALRLEMDKAQSNGDAITAGYVAGQPTGSYPKGDQPGAQAPGQAKVKNWGDTSPELPPEAVAELKKNIGKPVKFANNQTWIMSQDGSTQRVQ